MSITLLSALIAAFVSLIGVLVNFFIARSGLKQKIQETRGELGKLQTDGAKGTLRKESGKIKAIKRDIARMMTRLSELKNQ